MSKVAVLFIVLTSVPLWSQAPSDDFQYWSSYNGSLLKQDRWSFSFYGEGRGRDDAGEAFGYFFGPTFKYKLSSWLRFGGGAKMGHFKSGEHFRRFQRYEGEVLLDFKLPLRFKFRNRYRYEYFRREARADSVRHRFRLRLDHKLKSNNFASQIFFGTEFFYNEATANFPVTRIVPFGISLKLSKKLNLSVFYLIEDLRGSSRANHVLGTALSF